ncbi:MAG: D-2-hydroxyacid dehydrogenase [Clostridia bacterium]|nr:D-2-hydroxyacid dehydrogenase [Clostridia bacterium]
MKILLTERATLVSNGDLSLEVFNRFGEVTVYDNISRSELLREATDAEIILCNKALINREVMDVAQKLRYVGLFATGYNNVDIEYAKKRGITVCNVAGYSTNAVVQQVIGYILMHYTKIAEYNSLVKSGGWKRSETFSMLSFPSDEVFGKTLGIIGYGSIGKAVERAATGLGMKTQIFTRTKPMDADSRFVSLEQLLKTSDIVTVHCPLNEQSADMMNEKTFSMMKRGAFFINTSRGGVVDEKALAKALESGQLSGAAIDVIKNEPMPDECLLDSIPNLIITPHTAWAPLATRKRLTDLVAENLDNFLNGKAVNNLAE